MHTIIHAQHQLTLNRTRAPSPIYILFISSTLIDAHTLPGQTEGLKVGCIGKNKVFIKPLALGWFAKVDNRFGYEKWLQGGSIRL
jgi:hypothetical protein